MPHEGRSPRTRAPGKEKGGTKKSPRPARIPALCEAWAEAKPRARVVCRQLAEAAGEIEPWRLTEVIPRALLDRWKRTLARGTVNYYGMMLRTLLHHLTEFGSTVHPRTLGRIPTKKPRITTATQDELERLYTTAPDHLRLYLALIAETALRSGEAVALTPDHADTSNLRITITAKKTGDSKTLPISPEAARLIEQARALDPHGSCVLALTHGKITNPGSLRNAWNTLKRRAGIRPDLTAHDLRRTAAVELYRQTLDILAVQKLLGHRSATSTLWYLAPYDPGKLEPLLKQIHHPAHYQPKPN